MINFGLNIIVFFIFAAIDGIPFSPKFIAVLYPTICLLLINIGVGMIVSALYVFFKDLGYLYEIFTHLLRYMSAIFYRIDSYPAKYQRLFLVNPVYDCIKFMRVVVIDGHLPSLQYHLLLLAYACFFLLLGVLMYKKYDDQFIYYL